MAEPLPRGEGPDAVIVVEAYLKLRDALALDACMAEELRDAERRQASSRCVPLLEPVRHRAAQAEQRVREARGLFDTVLRVWERRYRPERLR